MSEKKAKLNPYDKLTKEYNEKVEDLQVRCKHKELSKWMEYHWAIGHGTGRYVRVCQRCDKYVYQKSRVHICKECGEINSIWSPSVCMNCKEENVLEPYTIIKKNGKITWKCRIKKHQ